MTTLIQPSYAKGEISPALYGRVDTAAYHVGLRTARNMIIHPHGGCSNRPGTVYIGPCKDHSYAPRLIRFQFKTSDAYVLEFGEQYMRVIRDDGYVLETPKTITAATAANPIVITAVAHGFATGDQVFIENVAGMTRLNDNFFTVLKITADTFSLQSQITGAGVDGSAYSAYTSGGIVSRIYTLVTPYAQTDLSTLKYVQSSDVMTLTHPTYPVQELSRTGHAAWTIAEPTFAPTMDFPTDIAVTTGEVGAASVKYKVTAIARSNSEESLPGTIATNKTITAATASNPVVITSASHGYSNGDEIHIENVVGMTELNGRRFTVANQATNTFELLGEDGSMYVAYVSGGDAWLTFYKISAVAITAATKASPCVVTAAGHGFANNEVVHIGSVAGMVELNNRAFTVAGRTATTINLQDPAGTSVDSTTYTTYTSGGAVWKEPSDNTITWTAVDGAAKYAVYKATNGAYGLLGITEDVTFNDYNIEPDASVGPPSARNPFYGVDNYPATAGYYEQRRVMGGSNDAPDASDYSKIGASSNFAQSSPLLDDDAFRATLTAQNVQEIRHYVPGNDLLVFTSSSEWDVNSGPDAAFSATSIKQKPQSAWGAGHQQPIVAGDTVLYVGVSNAEVRSFTYNIQKNGYGGSNLNLLANHLLKNATISQWSFAHSPESRVHIVRSDGQALTMTFEPEQEVVAWTHWDTLRGKFEDVVSLTQQTSSTEDGVYFVVKRKINGSTVRYVERVGSRRFVAVEDAYFVDCGLSYDNPAAITAITQANPIVVTAAGHGFANGDEVDFSDIIWHSDFDATDNETQPDQLNGHRYTVASVTTDTFRVTDSDGNAIDGSAYNFYAESGYVRKAVSTISGLDHLEGEDVAVLSNGDVTRGLTVSAGSITLPRKGSRVHIGLKFISDFETLDIEAGRESLQGQWKKVSAVTVRVENSRGFFAGPDSSHLVEAKWRELEGFGEPTALLTGDKRITLTPQWNTHGRVFLRQRDPLPLTVLATIPEFTL